MPKLNRVLKNKDGATAVEFALVAPFLITTILFIMYIGICQYYNMELDYATNAASRQIMTGSAQSSATTRANFTNTLCSKLPAMMSCSNVIVNLYTVSKSASPGGYYSFTKSGASGLIVPDLGASTGQFQMGVQGDYQYLQVVYPINFLPSFIASIFSANMYKGSPAFLAISTAAFRNERY